MAPSVNMVITRDCAFLTKEHDIDQRSSAVASSYLYTYTRGSPELLPSKRISILSLMQFYILTIYIKTVC